MFGFCDGPWRSNLRAAIHPEEIQASAILPFSVTAGTLAVIEALLCRNPVTYQSVKDDLTGHFQRLLGYFPGALFFHFTYSYVDEPSSVLRHLKLAAEREVPPGFTYKGITKDIELTDSRPPGFIAEYEGPMGRLKVVFLVLDMRQLAQREAAKAAGIH